MKMDQHISTPISEEKFRMHVEHDSDDGNRLIHSRFLEEQQRSWNLKTLILLLLTLVLIIIVIVLSALFITRRNTCRQLQLEQAEGLLGYKPDGHMKTWVPCVKSSASSCTCPAGFVHSSAHPSHCVSSHSRCLKSCKHNLHCQCYHLTDPYRCRFVTKNWVDMELKRSPVERFRNPSLNHLLQQTWTDHFTRRLEHLLADVRTGERLFFSFDRRTGIVIHEQDDDYLLNERWTKVGVNGSRQHIVYAQLSPSRHVCRMSSLQEDGSITHGPSHACPGAPLGAPYYLGVACHDVLVLWHGHQQVKLQRAESWTTSRHHFEATVPHLPVLFDPFHRYYSLYDDDMIEIKDLNGDVLAQFFTDIKEATRFEFLDHFGTIWIANQTHMQSFRSINDQAWLDF